MSHNKDHAPSNFKNTNYSILNDPSYNKGTAFLEEERDKLKLRGLLPPHIESLEKQEQRAYQQLKAFDKNIDKYVFLSVLQSRNETLFYRLILNHLRECLPLIYTPTVGEACQKFGQLFRQQKGMYFCLFKDKGMIAKMLDNWPYPEPDIIVVTDGSRILGLGDLGAGGMGIPIGKLSLYTAGAGFHPVRTLPICLDVGTNNKNLLNDPFYLGEPHARVRGPQFYEFVEEFLMAIKQKWPHTLVQFEDFSNDVCFDILEKYQDRLLCFNDDIQGTGAVITAGFINAMKLQGVDASKQKIVFFGAGSAAVGVSDQIATMIHMKCGISIEEARKQFYLVDSKGLVRTNRGDELQKHKIPYARHDFDHDLPNLLAVVKEVKPTALIGLSGVGKTFTPEIIQEMAKNNAKPIIFSLSNPTENSECYAADAYLHSNGTAIFAGGSPFPDYEHQGKTLRPSQGNNMYIFPGLGLGGVIAKATKVSDTMIVEAANSLAEQTSAKELEEGKLYPDLSQIRSISWKIAAAVAKQCFKEGLSHYKEEPNWEQVIANFVYHPEYVDLNRSKM